MKSFHQPKEAEIHPSISYYEYIYRLLNLLLCVHGLVNYYTSNIHYIYIIIQIYYVLYTEYSVQVCIMCLRTGDIVLYGFHTFPSIFT